MAKKAKKTKSKIPYGLTISRSENKYTFKWSKGETYKDGQQVAYSLNSGKYKALKVSATATTVNTGTAIKAADYFPTAGKTKKLSKVKFRIRGNADSGSGKKKDHDTWSNWAYKEITLRPPSAPAITFELDDTLSNKGTFNWSLDTSSDRYRVSLPDRDLSLQEARTSRQGREVCPALSTSSLSYLREEVLIILLNQQFFDVHPKQFCYL